jgi:hypothetical protein
MITIIASLIIITADWLLGQNLWMIKIPLNDVQKYVFMFEIKLGGPPRPP